MRLISIDPGTTTCGIAIWDIGDNFNIIDLTSFTLVIDRDIYLETRISMIRDYIFNIIKDVEPFQLIHESGFIDRFRPQAYGPIYAVIYNIREAFKLYFNYSDDERIFMYPPKNVKARLATGTADKSGMLEAVSSIDELKPFITLAETEHAIDAIAIGYTHLLNIREMPELLLL